MRYCIKRKSDGKYLTEYDKGEDDYTDNFNLIFWYESLTAAIRDTVNDDVVESEREVALLKGYEVIIRYYKYRKVVICP